MKTEERIALLEEQIHQLRGVIEAAIPKMKLADHMVTNAAYKKPDGSDEQLLGYRLRRSMEAMEVALSQTKLPEYAELNAKDRLEMIRRTERYMVAQKIGHFSNKVFKGAEKEYPSNVADILNLWISTGHVDMVRDHSEKLKQACLDVDKDMEKDK